jgi:glycosyltransferase involved in cell wall biosynthesis
MADLLGRPDRVHVLPALPTAARSLLERPGWGVPAFRGGFDVVHGTKHLLPRNGRSRRVLTVHDLLPIDRPQDFPWLKRRALVGPYRASVRDADVLLCVSAATRDRLVEDQPSAAPRAAVVPLAMSSALRTAVARPVPQLVGRRFTLVVGDASPRKNLAVVVAAWQQVVARDPDAVLAFIGPAGWGVEQRGERYDRLVADGAILPLGAVGDDVLRWCYENARVVACPSLLEGFGLPSIEALHFGAPLVTSTDAALVEASGAAAQHLPPDDVDGWAAALTKAITTARPVAALRPTRTWAAVADESVRAVRTGWSR